MVSIEFKDYYRIMGVNMTGATLALGLLEELEPLRARLRRREG